MVTLFSKGNSKICSTFLIIFLVLIQVRIEAQCVTTLSLSESDTAEICKGGAVSFSSTSQNAGSNPQYYWYVNNNLKDSGSSFSSNFSNSSTVTVTLIAANDTCFPDTLTQSFEVKVEDIKMSPTSQQIACGKQSTEVTLSSITGGDEPYSIKLDTTELGQSRNLGDLYVGDYQIIITDSKGCVDTNTLQITKKQCYVPQPLLEFSPNGDGYLDKWYIGNIEKFPNNKVYIYDRWGQRMYYTQGYSNLDAWDGTYESTAVPSSVYYYIIDEGIKDSKGKEVLMKGSVTLIR